MARHAAGELRAGPSASGGFLVAATLPAKADRPGAAAMAGPERPQ